MTSPAEIPDAMRPDALDTWPSLGGTWSGVGDSMDDFAFRPGEDLEVHRDDPAAMAAARHYRDVLGRFASGVTVVSAVSDGAAVGLTCQSFSSVSLDPPLVLFIPARTSRAWPLIRRAGAFCVNFLADGQQQLSTTMSGRGTDKYAGLDWTPSAQTGSPLLSGTLGYVDCTIHAVHETGDHDIVIGRVVDLDVRDGAKPLLFYRGAYATTD